ncbi:MAG: radical SAM protein [Burkholderiales bacterium]|nr:radical SAM protein [Burkholderiales bacterium]MDP2396745.1 radical SAM protein [Burkholderiales bacterium]
MTITERIDNITRIPPEFRHAQPPAPKSVKIEISPRCNYRCGFCALRTREIQPKWDMDFQLFRRITREMREAGVEEIGVFYLGESFMNPRLLVDCIAWTKQELRFPYVFLTSNASMAFPEAVEACMQAGLDSLKWSVNAADEAQFEQIMGVSGKLFHRALDNIRTAHDLRSAGGFKTGLYASSIRYDGDQQLRMEELLREKVLPWVDSHYWLPLYSMGAFATQREEQLGYRPTAGNQGRIGALREPLPCWSAFTEGHVTSEGRLSACCFDATAHWTMGDLNEMPFMSAWHSDNFTQLRAAHLKKDVRGTVCGNCIAYG